MVYSSSLRNFSSLGKLFYGVSQWKTIFITLKVTQLITPILSFQRTNVCQSKQPLIEKIDREQGSRKHFWRHQYLFSHLREMWREKAKRLCGQTQAFFQIRERLNGRPKLKFASTVAQPMLYQSEFRNHCNKLNTHANSKNSIRHSLVKHGDLCHVSSTCLALIDSLANFSVHLGRLLCFAFFFLFFFESGTLPNAAGELSSPVETFDSSSHDNLFKVSLKACPSPSS